MMRTGCKVILVGLFVWSAARPALAAIAGIERVASGLSSPVFATHAPGDRDRLFVLEKGGAIKIVDLNTKSVTGTFMTVTDTDSAGEGGLVGLAFHPNYFNAGQPGYSKFYVYVTVDNGGLPIDGVTSPFSSRIREYSVTANPNVADPGSKNEVLSWVQPASNHNGGWIGFNPAITPGEPQYLYVNSGDGGKQGDPDNNAQTLVNEPLGKILRIDVNSDAFPGDDTRDYAIPPTNPFVGTTGDDEIWAYGVRNPWRGSFDRGTGDYWVGDVGQGAREEIDRVPYGTTDSINFGWKRFEGDNDSTPALPVPTDYVPPVYDYGHGSGSLQGNAVIGGYVYRGPDPSLQGTYFFADNTSGHRWRMDPATAEVINIDGLLVPDVGNLSGVASLAEDEVGNLYYVGIGSGSVYRLRTNELLAGDYDADGDVDDADYEAWQTSFGTTGAGPAADGSGNGVVDAADYTVWRDHLGNSVGDLGGGSGAVGVPEPASAVLLATAGLLGSALGWRRRICPLRGQTNPSHNASPWATASATIGPSC